MNPSRPRRRRRGRRGRRDHRFPATRSTGIGPAVPTAAPTWWIRPGLEAVDGRLAIAGRDAEALARESGTPLFVYDLERLAENARAVVGALGRTGVHHRVRFALKANREPEVLAVLRGLGAPGSPDGDRDRRLLARRGRPRPRERLAGRRDQLHRARTCPSATSTPSCRPASISTSTRSARSNGSAGAGPGGRIGLRVNPGAGAGYHAGLTYSGERPTKFGIYPDRLDEAVAVARRHDLTIDTVHFHAGSGWLADGLDSFEAALVGGGRDARPAGRPRLPDRRGQRRRRARGAGP